MQSVHRTDVDDAGGDLMGPGRGERRVQEAGEVEHALHIEIQHPIPCGVVELRKRCAPGGAGIVDEDVETAVLSGDDLVGQSAALVLGGEISGQRDAFADGAELGGDLIADRCLARRHVDLGASFDEATGDHEADTAGTAGDEGDLARDVEEIVHGVCMSSMSRCWERSP